MREDFDPARRTILKYGALTAAGFSLFRRSNASTAAVTSAPLNELRYAQVQFAAGPMQRQASENHSLVLNLDEDALLRPFRLRAGLPAPGQELGGWYNTYGFAPGATFGQWMSALSRYYAITGDSATRDKVSRLVRGYAATVDTNGAFYRHNRFPAYTYDKLTGGLIDAHTLASDRDALPALQQTTLAAIPYLPPHAIPRNEASKPNEDFTRHAWDESYTLPENQFLAFRATGDARHRVLARRFLYDDFFRPLANGQNVLPGKHAYSHVNALSSAAQAHLSLGQPMYLQAAMQGFAMVDAQSFATGGWGPDEHFVVPGKGALAASLDAQHKSFETPCGAYAHIKLTRYLLRITRDPRYGDSMERVLYNTVLGAKPIQPDGRAFYYSDYTRRAQKTFYDTPWPCCSGTLPMIAADYRISAFFTDTQGIYVNLYVPGQVSWRQGGDDFRLSIHTDYPHASAITMDVQTSTPQTFTVNLRVPAWAQGASLRVNGKSVMQPIHHGSFAAIRRQWRSGDRIELDLPLALHAQAVDAEHPDTLALLAGPLVLMRLLDTAAPARISRRALLSARADNGNTHQWQIATERGNVQLKPFLAIDRESYSVYQDVLPA